MDFFTRFNILQHPHPRAISSSSARSSANISPAHGAALAHAPLPCSG